LWRSADNEGEIFDFLVQPKHQMNEKVQVPRLETTNERDFYVLR